MPSARSALVGALLAATALALAPRSADAFCGFYVAGADAKLVNNATNVVLMREGTRTVLSMQNDYQGPPENFAMVVPVPVVLQKENVKTLSREVFDRVDQLAAPRLVEYWEQDPCPVALPQQAMPAPPGMAMGRAAAEAQPAADLGVKIEAQFTVGEYEIVILSASDSAGLDTWLRQQRYRIPSGAEPLLRPYVQAGSKFFVAKVDVTKVRFEAGRAALSPLRFHYDSADFVLPVRLGLVNSAGVQDLLVHVLARGKRFDIANYPPATIPTNIDVSDATRDSFGSFYASLFDRTIARNPRAVVTEYSWDASSCDPCPTPPLTPSELGTLGLDALPAASTDFIPLVRLKGAIVTRPNFQGQGQRIFRSLQRPIQGCYARALEENAAAAGDVELRIQVAATGRVASVTTKGGETLGRSMLGCVVERARAVTESVPTDNQPATVVIPLQFEKQPSWQRTTGFVLTRLHARYGKDGLAEDLVFREAPPITGGREVRGPDERLEKVASAAGFNNFQARYAIRHPWTGPIACANPRRGIWGGPPHGVAVPEGGGRARPALKVAFAPRNVELASFLRQDVPELGFLSPAKPKAVAGPPTSPTATAAVPPPAAPASGGSCGSCRIGGDDSVLFGAGASLIAALATFSRRRKRLA